MHEIGRGAQACEAPPVLGTFVDLTARSAPAPSGAPAVGGLDALVDDHEVASLPLVVDGGSGSS